MATQICKVDPNVFLLHITLVELERDLGFRALGFIGVWFSGLVEKGFQAQN